MIKYQRLLITKGPVGLLLQQTKHWHLPGFEGVPLYDVIRFFYRQLKTHGLFERASAISYNFIMAIPPSLLFLFTLIPNLPFISKKSIQIQLHTLIFDIIPAKVYNREVIKFVDSFIYDSRIALLSFSLLFSLFFASSAMMGLMRSFNKKYLGFQQRKGLHQRWIAIKLTMLLFGLLFLYLLLLISQGAILKLMVKDSGWRQVIGYSRWAFIILLIFYAIAFIFKYAPAVHIRWKLNSPGTILATFLSILATIGFSEFVNNFGRYNVLYGSIGTIMMVMALIYINSLALLIGFELNVSIKSLKAIAMQRESK
ncbi:MAG: YihY/virulence factor BrkB family protein [Ferruginibacter sp.]